MVPEELMLYIYLAFFLSIMNLTSIKILLPEIMIDLAVDLNWLTWVVNSYTLPMAALIPVAGRVGDMYGPRRFFLGGIFILGLGSLMCGMAFSLGWLIAGRVLQALGAALLVPNSLAVVLEKTGAEKRGQVLGIWGGIGASGAVVGPVVSGGLADIFTWRGAFIAIALLALIITLSAGRQMVKNRELGTWIRKTAGRFDSMGAFVLMSAIAILLLGITLLPDLGLQNNWIRLSIVSFIALIFLFYRIEKFASEPLISPVLLQEPRFNLGLLVGFIEQLVIAGTLFIMPIFFSTVQGHGPATTALLLIPAAASVAIFSPVGGRISDRIGPGAPIVTGMILRTGSFIMLALTTVESSYLYIGTGLALNGLGFALTSTPALHAVLSTVSDAQHGIATGVHNMIRFTGAAAGTTIGGIILYALMPAVFEGLSGPIPGFREAFIAAAAVCLPGIAAGVWLIKLGK
jgi:EmrB/QacA subfamily drug resistance transporter